MTRTGCIWFLLLLGMACQSLNGQLMSSLPDSVLLPPQADAQDFQRLSNFGDAVVRENPALAREAFQVLKSKSLAQENHRYLGESYRGIGLAYLFTDRTDSAFTAVDSAQYFAHAIGDSSLIYRIKALEGMLHFNVRSLEDALEAYRSAQAYFKKTQDPVQLGQLTKNIGNIYLRQGNYQVALEHYREALACGQETGQKELVSAALNNSSLCYYYQDMLDSAEFYLSRCYQFNHQNNLNGIQGQVCAQLAMLRMQQGRMDEVESVLQEGLEAARGVKAVGTEAQLLIFYSRWLQEQGQFAQAAVTLDSALRLSQEAQIPGLEIEAEEARYELWKAGKNYEKALSAFERLTAIKDSLFAEERVRSLEELTTKHQTERKQEEILRLQSEQELQNRLLNQQYWLIGGLGLVFLSTLAFLFFAISSARRRRRDNQVLQEQNARIDQQQQEILVQNDTLAEQNRYLETLNAEMEGLIEIVAHDLKSPISKTQAVVELIQKQTEAEGIKPYAAMAQEILEGGMQMIQNILTIRRIESQEEALRMETIDLPPLLSRVLESFQPRAREKGIQLHFQGKQLSLNTVPSDLERILENLLSNALKFSLPNTQVTLSLAEKENQVEISIQDQGPGISPDDQSRLFQKFQRLSAQPTGGESSTGLGLAIVKALVNRMQGSISVESEVGKGTTFKILFPLDRGQA